MAGFEERFAAFGRAIDEAIDRFRAERKSKPYRSSRRRRRSLAERWKDWRVRTGDRAVAAASSAADWRRTLDTGSVRRLNLLLILGAMVVTALATWMWTRGSATGLSAREVEALARFGRAAGPSSTPPSGGAWWDRTAAAAPASGPAPK